MGEHKPLFCKNPDLHVEISRTFYFLHPVSGSTASQLQAECGNQAPLAEQREECRGNSCMLWSR